VPVPDVLPADPLYTGYANIPASAIIEGHTKGYWTSQTGGTCGGFGTAQGKIDDFSNPDSIVILDGMDQYYAIREGNVPAAEVKNINAGVQSSWIKICPDRSEKGRQATVIRNMAAPRPAIQRLVLLVGWELARNRMVIY